MATAYAQAQSFMPHRGPGAGALVGAPPGSGSTGAVSDEAKITTAINRSLIDAQESAYEKSLAADREKELAKEAAKRREEDEARKQRAAEAEAEEARVLDEVISASKAEHWRATRKQMLARLPAEPGKEDPEAVAVALHFPRGKRLIRRVLRSQAVGVLFDFVESNELWPEQCGVCALSVSHPSKVLVRAAHGAEIVGTVLSGKRVLLFVTEADAP